MQTPGLHLSRTLELDDEHEVTVTLVRRDRWRIDLIDLNSVDVADLECPDAGPFDSEEEALAAALQLARAALAAPGG